MKLLSVFVTLLVFPFVAYEGIRFYQTHQTCLKERRENEAILGSVTCDAWHRHQFGDKVNGVCKQAEQEVQISPLSCAWKHMWSEGEVYRVWTMFTESYVMLWATSVPIVCFLIWTWFAAHTTRVREERMISMQGKMYEKTLELMQKPPSPVLEQGNYVDLVETRQRSRRMNLIQ